ncbi:malonate-semialdehyde dehydrogenase (acetylating)/methylmalonate-semialdehyde dehydrogenase [Geomicrobium halophilum]|uniref:methylmalonate-semialdehyde dehydrogenase (CoA acylating) n=1 Tax=Geomicrobium halophilum TaxID=549000 RepID=A0A841PMH6_9BACL|nr:CoA-acylating methylmalonate-semialdehyde dehydrogenase [Geomicrobium halophilum]MBB6450057.1 malonate-semialdehyde dehydrogenase (acetylating)/methylmalonate-semialdehyde dehydrogenase [Geomicrobium halophilum]
MTRILKNYINGEWTDSDSDGEDIYNPADGSVIAHTPHSTKEDVEKAVQSARDAYQYWRKVPVPKRARYMYTFHELLVKHHEELAKLLTKENGKTYKDAYGEVLRGIENVEFASGAPELMKGETLPDIANGIESGMYRYPVGVVGGITPFNFPMMVPCWMFPLAIVCGNTFVLKPSERTPLLAQRLAELLEETGIPKGVFNIVHGAKDVVNGLLENKEVNAISFVGSQPVAEHVYQTASQHGKRVQALGGAKNHSIVLHDANLNKTVEGVMNGAFGSAGQRCMATSVCVVQEDIADDFVAKLNEACDQLTIGDGLDPNVDLGPVIRGSHLQKVRNYIDLGEKQNAVLVRDGRKDIEESANGFYLGATIFDHVTTDMTIWEEEIFAPVLCVIRVKDLSEAIAITNESDFGNGSVLYTSSGPAVQEYREDIEVGMLGVNVNVPAPMAFFPFSGWKQSFYGDLHTNGRDGVEFYTRKKMLTSRWFD